MKTTLEIPDDLFRRAKAHAASRGMSLRQLVTEAVEQRLRAERVQPGVPAWRKLSGRLRALRVETGRVQRLIDAEFERIDEDDREGKD